MKPKEFAGLTTASASTSVIEPSCTTRPGRVAASVRHASAIGVSRATSTSVKLPMPPQ
jgi:hypothetical protein